MSGLKYFGSANHLVGTTVILFGFCPSHAPRQEKLQLAMTWFLQAVVNLKSSMALSAGLCEITLISNGCLK